MRHMQRPPHQDITRHWNMEYFTPLALLRQQCLLVFYFSHTQKTCTAHHTSNVATPLWGKCEDETHIPKSENLESSGTPENSELDYRGQNTLHWGVLYIVGKVLKCRCPKWPRMSHLNICKTSYGRKKGWESNWQFDSRPLKVKNRPDPDLWRWSATHYWKDLEKSYKFTSDLIPIKGLSWELWAPKVPKVQTETVSRILLGSPGTKSHLDVAPVGKCR
jgi:hypothetical protein